MWRPPWRVFLFRIDSWLLSAASLPLRASIKPQTVSSRPAGCLVPGASNSRGVAPLCLLPPLSFPTTGGYYPSPLCLCDGKKKEKRNPTAHPITAEEAADNYMGWQGAESHSGPITQATTADTAKHAVGGGTVGRGPN